MFLHIEKAQNSLNWQETVKFEEKDLPQADKWKQLNYENSSIICQGYQRGLAVPLIFVSSLLLNKYK